MTKPIYWTKIGQIFRFNRSLDIMGRAVKDAKLDTPSARAKLKVSGKPHYRALEPGLHLGYRKGKKGGKWVVRVYDPENSSAQDGYAVKTLEVITDDNETADGFSVLSFAQAQVEARKYATARRIGDVRQEGPYRVCDAVEDYKQDFIRRGGKGLQQTEYTIQTHILPPLGDKEVSKLTRRQLRDWHQKVAEAPARKRTKKEAEQKYRELSSDEGAIRSRRSTANRVLTVLKAALNHAYNEGLVADNNAWAGVKPFKGVDAPKVRYLSDDECTRLINACPTDLRAMVAAALLTGCRYSELANLKGSDYDAKAGAITIPDSKSGKPRHVFVTDEGKDFFEQATVGKNRTDLMFIRDNGMKWGHAHQTRPLREASEAAKIFPHVGFHILRHTYGSRLAMNGVPMAVIAEQLGHADTRITEKHYAHLGPSYVANTVREAFGELGILRSSNVKLMRHMK